MRTSVVLATLLWSLSDCASAKPPHIVFIVSDDLGWDDVGFRSHQIRTPNIDHLAADGLVLNQYYVQSVCSPSRATFMTGRYPLHHTVNDWLVPGRATGLPLNETLLPHVLAASAAYRSHATGKWHLGFTYWEHTPTFRGFESFVGFYSGGEGYFNHQAGHYDFRRDMQPQCGANCSQLGRQDMGRYSTFIFAERAVQVIHEHAASEPLFLYLAFQAVHAPQQVPKQYSDAYLGIIDDTDRRRFAGMLSCMDEGIGNVTQALRLKGMLKDTVIIFTTDNGGPSSKKVGGDAIGSRNFPLRGGKHSIWEGGTRGLGVVWAGAATGLLPPDRRGTVTDTLMHGADWFPTLCNIAGIIESCTRLPLDGYDQTLPLFTGARGKREEVFYGQHDDSPNKWKPYDTAIRDSDGWKLIQGWGGMPDEWSRPVNQSSGSGRHLGDADGGVHEWLESECCPEASVLLDDFNHSTEGECCAACLRQLGCSGYNFQASVEDCFLSGDLSSCGRRLAKSAAAEATPSGGGVMLFNVHYDPSERHEVSAEYPEVVKRLTLRLDALRADQVDVVGGGGHPDPDCPKYNVSEHVDAVVGHFWAPWCERSSRPAELYV